MGLDWLGVKRDDLLDALLGGTKPRKLDYLLAAPPFVDARRWASLGAIGSGHLLALGAAAARLDKELEAHCFWETPSEDVLANLAALASGPTELHFHRNRVLLALRRPSVLLGRRRGSALVIPPGATTPDGMLGLVRAAFELAGQIEAHTLPLPDRIYVALGSGGTTAGLAVGLGLAGVETTLRAIATVEHPFATRRRLESLIAALRRRLVTAGASLLPPVQVEIDRRFLGAGYGHPTPAGRSARGRLADHGIVLEDVYTAKAAAALLADATQGGMHRVLLWNTTHGPLPPVADDWRGRLPRALLRRLPPIAK